MAVSGGEGLIDGEELFENAGKGEWLEGDLATFVNHLGEARGAVVEEEDPVDRAGVVADDKGVGLFFHGDLIVDGVESEEEEYRAEDEGVEGFGGCDGVENEGEEEQQQNEGEPDDE